MTWGGKRRNKYNATKVVIDGITFDSKAEGKHYCELKIRQKVGEIRDLELQPKFCCDVNGKRVCTHKADFRYFDIGLDRVVVIDVKSPKTRTNEAYRVKKKLVEALHNIEITDVIAE